jgi:DNA repair exonuclease SbcCD ATPase subunit
MSKKIKLQKITPAVKYAGSLIQQNHSEALKHGYVVWDSNNIESKFVIIENDLCYYTLEVQDGVYQPIPDELKTKTIRLRIKSTNTSAADLKKILTEIKSSYTIEEYVLQKVTSNQTGATRNTKIAIGDVKDVEYQNELIVKYLNNKYILSDEMLDGIRHVNRTVNSSIQTSDVCKNVSWKPIKFEFSNMFSYGEDNVIDFTNLFGVYGLFAPNASGKSSLLDAISYCIFDKCSKTSKAIHVLNNKTSEFECKFEFELDNKHYFIEKRGKKGRNDHVRVDINFYSIDANGITESLNGKERSETNEQIRTILGSYEDFVLTALSVQNNNTGFIEMQQRERKDLLSQFLGINLFEKLYEIGNSDSREVAVLIKDYQRKDFSTQLSNAKQTLKECKVDKKRLESERIELSTKIDSVATKMLELSKKIIELDTSITDIDVLKNTQASVKTDINSMKTKRVELQTIVDAATQEITQKFSELSKYNQIEIDEDLNRLSKLIELKRELDSNIKILQINIDNNKSKLKHLDDLEYDESCSYCMNNVFVKDAISIKASFNTDIDKLTKEQENVNKLVEEINLLKPVTDKRKELDLINSRLQTLQITKSSADSKIHEIDLKIHRKKSELLEIENKISLYYEMETAVIENNKTANLIKLCTEKKLELESELNSVNSNLISVSSELLTAEKTINQCENSIDELRKLESQYKFYHYYLEAVSRDGVPYDLISNTVPIIEQEVNNILSQLVEFNLMLQMDGKNINCFIVYDQDNYWPIELTSGMEKFISSLAIRTALINISSLPRPNFLVIDEGLGNLDSEVLTEFGNLLNYLESQFTFIVIISHIESSRDMTKNLIEITKQNGFSKVVVM